MGYAVLFSIFVCLLAFKDVSEDGRTVVSILLFPFGEHLATVRFFFMYFAFGSNYCCLQLRLPV